MKEHSPKSLGPDMGGVGIIKMYKTFLIILLGGLIAAHDMPELLLNGVLVGYVLMFTGVLILVYEVKYEKDFN